MKAMWESNYETLVDALSDLNKKGYVEDFNLKNDCLSCNSIDMNIGPNDFTIDDVFRFDGATDPADESILYAISSERFGLKGVLVNGYGASSELLTAEMRLKLGHGNS